MSVGDLPRCCEHGLIYSEGRRCWRHASPRQRSLVGVLNERAVRVGVKHDAWPYGPNIDVESRAAMLTWAERRGLQLSRRGRCVNWLRKGRCDATALVACGEAWQDHVTGWNLGDQPAVLVSQPYGISDRGVVELGRLAADQTLHVAINARSWYGHGTVLVEVWREEAYEAFVKGGRP